MAPTHTINMSSGMRTREPITAEKVVALIQQLQRKHKQFRSSVRKYSNKNPYKYSMTKKVEMNQTAHVQFGTSIPAAA